LLTAFVQVLLAQAEFGDVMKKCRDYIEKNRATLVTVSFARFLKI